MRPVLKVCAEFFLILLCMKWKLHGELYGRNEDSFGTMVVIKHLETNVTFYLANPVNVNFLSH